MASTHNFILVLALTFFEAFGQGKGKGKDKWGTQQTCLQIGDYDRLIEKFATLEMTLSQKIAYLEATTLKQSRMIQKLELQLNNYLQNIPEKKTVAFSAHVSNKTKYVVGDRLVFTTPILNVGSGYDPLTGYFVAPVAGTYMFTLQVCNTDNNRANVFIKAAKKVIMSSTHQGSNGIAGTCVSYTGLSIMKAGDKAWVECSYASKGFVNDDWRWNTFSGILL